jgi:16S rRNA G966 N2-methylase RsmD
VKNNVLLKYIKNKEIYIDRSDWSTLKITHSIDELITCFSDLVIYNELKFPYKEVTHTDMKNDFFGLCKYIPSIKIDNNIYTKYDYNFPLQNHYIKNSTVGSLASDYFFNKVRYECDSIVSPSPIRIWNTQKFHASYFKSLFSLKYEFINSAVLRNCFSGGKYVAQQFKPAVAKTVYSIFNSKNILDFSAGWGDRLCGFYSCDMTEHYVGIDPNKEVFDIYSKQCVEYNNIITGNKSTEFLNVPAEEVNFNNYEFDTIFTSPPYFIMERYSYDSTQSWVRYKKLNDWLDKFLFTVIYNSWKSLCIGGHLVINITDVYVRHQRNEICNPLVKYIKDNISNAQFLGMYGLQLNKRTNNKYGIFVEPLLIWKKI